MSAADRGWSGLPMFYLANAVGTVTATSPALRTLLAGPGGRGRGELADQLHGAIERLRAGAPTIALRHAVPADGATRELFSWHWRDATPAGEAAFVGVFLDAGARDLAAAPGAADAANRTKDALLSHVSHELRTPLNAIIGFAELSLQQIHGRLDGRYLGYLADIRSAARQLLHVVNNLLESAAEEDADSPAGAAVQLAGVVSQAKAHVAPLAAARGIDLTGVRVADDCIVLGDPQRLQRILRQLLSNAIKFTRSQGRIGVEVARPDGASVEIAVWDTGIGIPADRQTRIFESFAQLSTDVMSRPRDGLGLGLALARRLARQMGGDIRVESATGLGSRFIVTLPLTPAGRPAV